MRTRAPAVAVLTLMLAACGGSHPPVAATPASHDDARRLDALADDYFATWVRTFPVSGLFAGIPDAPNEPLDENNNFIGSRLRPASA